LLALPLLPALACSSATPEAAEPPTDSSSDDQGSGESTDTAAPGDGEPLPADSTSAGDCGGMQGLSCGEGEFCLYSLEATCGAADQLGTCTTVPEICTMDYRPVCGCDDKTYSNSCAAHSKGVSVANEGEC